MLWKFSFTATSNIESLFSREAPPSVEELMDENDLLSEVKAQNNKVVTYLARDDVIKSLLQWVIAGLDELDQQADAADSATFSKAVLSPNLYPAYQVPRPVAVPGTGPGSPPLEPAKIEKVDEEDDAGSSPLAVGLGQGLDRVPSRDEDSQRSKYPSIATELLTAELWSIPDTVMANKEAFLRPFWDAVLPPIEQAEVDEKVEVSPHSLYERGERQRVTDEFRSDEDEERDRKREVIRGLWVRVNGHLLAKRTTEMIRFVQTLPNIVERIMARIESPAIQDMLLRIVSSEEAGVSGVVEWLGNEGLIPRLLALLSPHHPTSTHIVAGELLKSIITLCAPSPFNPAGGNAMEQQGQVQPLGARDNRLIRELVGIESVKTMVGFMLDDVPITDADWPGVDPDSPDPSPADPFIVHPLPSLASATSSLSQVCSILVEIIRRNNSDFSEPHLFHTLRNKLMGVQMPAGGGIEQEDEQRQRMEDAMVEFSAKMGIVHLGNLLEALSDRFGELHRFLLAPRTQTRAASSVNPKPLTLERFRVIELYAELLHSSNMSILNRRQAVGPSYSLDGILSGGLSGLEALGEAIDGDRVGEEGDDTDPADHVTQARELPVSSGSTDCSLTGSEEVGSDDEGMLEDMDDETTPSPSPAASRTLPPPADIEAPAPPPPSQENVARLRDMMGIESTIPSSSAVSELGSESHAAVAATTAAPSIASEPYTPTAAEMNKIDEPLVLGDRLKSMFIQYRAIPVTIDLFFQYPNNNFLHHVVYDIFQQILNGRLGPGLNRELVIELIREGKLIERVLDAQRLNERMVKQNGTPRMANMGHIILIAEELVKFLARCPPELFEIIKSSFNQSEWDAFVDGALRDTKTRDSLPLAGGKPAATAAAAASASGVEGMGGKDDDSSDEDEDDGVDAKFGEPLTRTTGGDGFVSRSGFEGEGDDYWRNVSAESSRRQAEFSDDDDDDADWLRPSVSGNDRRSSDDEDFGTFSGSGQGRPASSDDFDDDEAWGTFNAGSPPSHSPDADSGVNPFDDDAFAPSVTPSHPLGRLGPQEPVTPQDWFEFDRVFSSTLPGQVGPTIDMSIDDDEGNDDDDDDRRAGFSGATGLTPGSHNTWRFEGDDDDGEELPPTISPIIPQTDRLGDTPQTQTQDDVVATLTLEATNMTITDNTSTSPTSSTTTIPDRSLTSAPIPVPTRRHRSNSISTPSGSSNAFSPPDSALFAATSPDEPLGPGVNSTDTKITPEGMLERQVAGEKIVVPQDEVVLGVEEERKRIHEGLGHHHI
ncbi:SIT4 phosphatase-associated protein-domain-containing protein [Naematelia encephala]|uniref:SIT4 phosphatase-associated protein-domain-containing protein n=1 Tax=Naematelia encephala TaxID=71784 RepID=A0A1Y2BLK7_9TREE|nr:SIT4 phosphatase-associated protein-domain-containing protein [Naematelia encephala]